MSERRRTTGYFSLPYLGWLVLFLFGPLIFVVVTSFQQKGLWGGIKYTWDGENYSRAFDPLYTHVIVASIVLACSTAFSCLVIGYPMAWFLSRMKPTRRKMGLLLVMLPFMSNFVVRAYAVKFLIGVEGPLNRLLLHWGWIDAPLFLNSPGLAVWFGMVTNYLPFMVLPLFVALERFEITLIEAARDLGASSWQTWSDVMWPLTKPAIKTGFALVFIPALGEFVIPDLMGGAKTMYMGNLLAEQFLKSRDWPFGSVMCVVMVAMVALVSFVAGGIKRAKAARGRI